MKKSITLLFALLFTLAVSADEPAWAKYSLTYQVKGNPNIESFVEAIFGYGKDGWDNDPTFDLKNGYFDWSYEGDGLVAYTATYWNMKDGNKLFIATYKSNELEGTKIPTKVTSRGYQTCWGKAYETDGETMYSNYYCGFRAFLYDSAKKQLKALDTPPFKGFPTDNKALLSLRLPQNGKNIRVIENISEYEELYHDLKWNGSSFDFEKNGNTIIDFIVSDKTPTNVRTAPNGQVIGTIPVEGSYTVTIDRIENGWCRIANGMAYENEGDKTLSFKSSTTGHWVHSSVLIARGNGDGSFNLYSEPNENSKVAYKGTDEEVFHPIEIRGFWIKVYVMKNGKRQEGWIKSNEICSNPLTNCC